MNSVAENEATEACEVEFRGHGERYLMRLKRQELRLV